MCISGDRGFFLLFLPVLMELPLDYLVCSILMLAWIEIPRLPFFVNTFIHTFDMTCSIIEYNIESSRMKSSNSGKFLRIDNQGN